MGTEVGVFKGIDGAFSARGDWRGACEREGAREVEVERCERTAGRDWAPRTPERCAPTRETISSLSSRSLGTWVLVSKDEESGGTY